MSRLRTAVCSAILVATLHTSRSEGLQYTGVNLAGAEFGAGKYPGTYGTDYIYPTTQEVDYFLSKGMNTIRLPFQWERLQPSANGAFNTAEFNRLNTFVNYATNAGAHVILDPHNYSRYYNSVDNASPAALANLWSRLANEYGNNPNVIFGLMNEPYEMTTEAWLQRANAAIAAIRAADASNLILVPGNAWTGAHSWLQNWYGTPNGTVMKGVVDPLDHFAFEVHQYLDYDSSGTHYDVASPTIGAERLQAFTAWLRDNGYQGFLGEFAAPGTQLGLTALDNMIDMMETNSDVWAGWTYWAAGPWWGDYPFSVEPGPGNTDKPQMAVLQDRTAPIPEPTASGLLISTALALLGIASLKKLRPAA